MGNKQSQEAKSPPTPSTSSPKPTTQPPQTQGPAPTTPTVSNPASGASTTTAPSDGKRKKAFYFDFLIGGVSATVSKTMVAPIERVKLLLQNQDASEQIGKDVKKYNGIGDCFKRVYSEQGLLSFWRGNFTNIIRYFPTQALNFALKDFYKKTLNPFDKNKEFWKFFFGNVASGGAAGVTSLLFVHPLDFARTRLSMDVGQAKKLGGKRQFNGLYDCLSKIYKKEGFFGFYWGFGISFITIFLYRGLYFGLFDTGKEKVFADPKKANFIAMWAFAQTVTITANMIVYPLDTVRRRLMMQSGRSDTLYRGNIHCIRKIIAEEGMRALYKGGASNLIRATGGALVLALYDQIQKIMGF